MTKEELIREHIKEIGFLEYQLKELLSRSGLLSKIDRLAIRANLDRIKELEKRIKELRGE